MDYVLPRHSGLRQWVLTCPFAWRPALGRDGALLGSLTRIFEQTVQGFYAWRAREENQIAAKRFYTQRSATLVNTVADGATHSR